MPEGGAECTQPREMNTTGRGLTCTRVSPFPALADRGDSRWVRGVVSRALHPLHQTTCAARCSLGLAKDGRRWGVESRIKVTKVKTIKTLVKKAAEVMRIFFFSFFIKKGKGQNSDLIGERSESRPRENL